MDRIEADMKFLRELLTCVHNLYFTEYDAGFNPVYSNAPLFNAIHIFLSLDGTMRDYSPNEIRYEGKPVLNTNSMGMTWISDMEMREGKLYKIHVLGPVFLDDFSFLKVDKALQKMDISAALKIQVKSIIKELPIIPILRFYEYGIMLHYCLTGEKIAISDFAFMDYKKAPQEDNISFSEERHGTYMMEQQLMKFIEDGNINYRKEKDRIISHGKVGKIASGDYLRQIKNAVIIHVALCSRAAIRGGLSPETAYLLSDRYLQSVENCNTLAEVTEISTSMYEDYVYRVHQIKTNSGISPQIQACCDYISLHLEEKLDVHAMASRVGYTVYYFTKKFKQETGLSVRDFAMKKKVERAKDLLKLHDKSIQDISDELGFSSQSYFGDVFHKSTGMTPGEFRLNGKSM